MKTEALELCVRGMICRSCVQEVEALLLHTRGIVDAKVSYLRSRAVVRYDPALIRPEEIERRLLAGGYETGARSWRGYALDGLCLLLTALLTWLLLRGQASAPALRAGSGFAAVFLAGLFASPHCAGMCGGILLSHSAQSHSPLLASLAYNAGRVFSYTALGAVFGAWGTALSYAVSVRSMVFTLLGLAVSLIGLNMWGLLPGLRALFPAPAGAGRLPCSARACFSGRPLLAGLLTGLMPCGALYAAWAIAVSAGSAAYGALSMLAFSLGTAPLLLFLGGAGSLFPKRWRRFFLKGSSVLVVAMGLKMLAQGLLLLH